MVFPDGKMPSATADRDVCRFIFRQTLTPTFAGLAISPAGEPKLAAETA